MKVIVKLKNKKKFMKESEFLNKKTATISKLKR
jgi:hypothetical protein